MDNDGINLREYLARKLGRFVWEEQYDEFFKVREGVIVDYDLLEMQLSKIRGYKRDDIPLAEACREVGEELKWELPNNKAKDDFGALLLTRGNTFLNAVTLFGFIDKSRCPVEHKHCENCID